ncbi:hypothetical protein F5Y16DRAFT_409121 [Xylariaceae sp. FL0255]|nr:hypothetical protein F5Y16DRAFT_409121 [Xylariaceae sp. FL0255]
MSHYSDLEVVPYEQSHEQPHPERPFEPPELVPFELIKQEQLARGGEAVADVPLPSQDLGEGEIKRRWCLPIKFSYALVLMSVLLILGAVGGGVAGGIVSRKSTNIPHMTVNQTLSPNVNVLAASQLTACNWTDPNNFTHRFVFFQDPYNAIIARRWNSQNRTWATDNLTALVVASSGSSQLVPLDPSTPLASKADSYQVHLFFLSSQNILSGYYVTNLSTLRHEWQPAAITTYGNVAAPGSQLASAWARCCPLFRLSCINQSNLARSTLVAESGSVAQNSSLAMFPQVDLNVPTNGLTRLSLMTEGLATSSLGTVDQTLYITDHWQSWDKPLGSLSLPLPSPRLQFAISALDNFNSPIFLALLPNGAVTSWIWRVSTQNYSGSGNVKFAGGPSGLNFSAITATEEAMFYGISNDRVLEYSINSTDPSTFDFVEVVYP